MTTEQKIRRFNTALIEYSKPLENNRFFPVINTEVLDTAEVIRSGEYCQESYRHHALALAAELRDATKAFLDAHK